MRQPPDSKQTTNARRLLISLAHPDDESFGLGGAIAHYAQQGVDISLICSTNGDVGTVDQEFMNGYKTISELRLAELQCAAETLGIREVIAFGYRDSGMAGTPDNQHPNALVQADEAVVTGRIVREIRRLRPHVVITFDPYGGYGHPDHIYMHHTTTRAFHAAGDPAQYPEQIAEGLAAYQPAKLYYTGFPTLPLRIRVWLSRLRGQDPRHLGRNGDIDLQAALDHTLPSTTRINVARYQDIWNQAAACHASQQSPRNSNTLLDRFQSIVFRHQDLTLVHPAPEPGSHRENDIFAGIASA